MPPIPQRVSPASSVQRRDIRLSHFLKNLFGLISTHLRVLSQRTISIFTMATKISHVAVLDSGFLTHLSCSFLDRNSIC